MTQDLRRSLSLIEQQHILERDVAVGGCHLADTAAAEPSPQTRCGWGSCPAYRVHPPPARHRPAARPNASVFLPWVTCAAARPESFVNTGLTGIFAKNSVKTHLESDNQHHFQNAANPVAIHETVCGSAGRRVVAKEEGEENSLDLHGIKAAFLGFLIDIDGGRIQKRECLLRPSSLVSTATTSRASVVVINVPPKYRKASA